MALGSQTVLGSKHIDGETRIKRDIETTQYDTEGAFVAPTGSVIKTRDSTNGAHTTSITDCPMFQYFHSR